MRLWALGLVSILPDLRPTLDSLPVHEREGVLQHRHHAEPEQIDFHDPHVGAVVLVPLHDDAAGHGGVLERDDGVEPSLADHHAAGVLAEMPRQILHLAPEPREQPDAIGLRHRDRPTARCRGSVSADR